MTSMNGPATLVQSRLTSLDLMRGIAIFSVFCYHAICASYGRGQLDWNHWLRDFQDLPSFLILLPFSGGAFGVACFFVVSGFCIHYSQLKKPHHTWRDYTLHRLFRIYPAYLLVCGFFLFLWPLFTPKAFEPNLSFQAITHFLGIHNITNATYFGINPSFWSIAIELQLYALYPVLLLILRRFNWTHTLCILAGIQLIACSTKYAFLVLFDIQLHHIVTATPFSYWFSWSLGAYIAQRYHDGAQNYAWLSKLRVDVLLTLCLISTLTIYTSIYSFTIYSITAAVILERLIQEKWQWKQHPRLAAVQSHFMRLGLISYGVYLLHQPFQDLTGPVTRSLFGPQIDDYPLIKLLLCVTITYPCVWYIATLLLKHVEMPIMKYVRTITSPISTHKPVKSIDS